MKIYTRKGDDGATDNGENQRVFKDDPLIELLGEIDELNSAIGIVLAYQDIPPAISLILTRIQHELFDFNFAILHVNKVIIEDEYITRLENEIDDIQKNLPPLNKFILPGGSPAGSHCHLTRAMCRRAERRLITLHKRKTLDKNILIYLNRLSDLLFVISLRLNQ